MNTNRRRRRHDVIYIANHVTNVLASLDRSHAFYSKICKRLLLIQIYVRKKQSILCLKTDSLILVYLNLALNVFSTD